MSYQYILFDLDGTITDSKQGITNSVAYALKYLGISVENPDTLCKFIGPPLTESFKEYYNLSDIETETAIQKYREYYSEKGIYENELYSEIIHLLEKLKQNGKKIILATSKPTIYAKKILEYFNLEQYFHFIAGSEMNLSRYKKEDVIRYAIEQNKIVDKVEVIMVGDRKHDIIGAKENEIASVGVLYGYGGREELSGADFIVEKVADLIPVLIK